MSFTMAHYRELQEANEGYWFDEHGVLYGPKASWLPIPENSTQPVIVPWSVILHTNAGGSPSTIGNLRSWITRQGVTGEPHFQIDNAGYIGQFMSIDRRADCNYSANSWKVGSQLRGAIAIETADLGAATVERTEWNMPQLQAIVGICTAAAVQRGTGCNESLRWDGHGVDYHSRWPYQGLGRPAWTNVRGKTCPGARRKSQCAAIRQFVAGRVGAYINGCNAAGIPHLIPGVA